MIFVAVIRGFGSSEQAHARAPARITRHRFFVLLSYWLAMGTLENP